MDKTISLDSMYEALFCTYVSFVSVGVDNYISQVSAKGFFPDDASSVKRYRQRMRLTTKTQGQVSDKFDTTDAPRQVSLTMSDEPVTPANSTPLGENCPR